MLQRTLANNARVRDVGPPVTILPTTDAIGPSTHICIQTSRPNTLCLQPT